MVSYFLSFPTIKHRDSFLESATQGRLKIPFAKVGWKSSKSPVVSVKIVPCQHEWLVTEVQKYGGKATVDEPQDVLCRNE